jgi:hypothetical protein
MPITPPTAGSCTGTDGFESHIATAIAGRAVDFSQGLALITPGSGRPQSTTTTRAANDKRRTQPTRQAESDQTELGKTTCSKRELHDPSLPRELQLGVSASQWHSWRQDAVRNSARRRRLECSHRQLIKIPGKSTRLWLWVAGLPSRNSSLRTPVKTGPRDPAASKRP